MTNVGASAVRAFSFLLAAFAGLSGCAGAAASQNAGPGAGGITGSGGSAGSCASAGCLPLAQLPATWIAEIDPPSSSTAAITFDGADLAKQSPALPADAQATATATFSAPSNAPVPAKATAILTIASPIPGRPPLTFQAPATAAATGVLTASLVVPRKMLGSPVTLTLVPLRPADQQNPPYTFSTVLGGSMQATIATDNFTISGSLLTAVAQVPQTTFVAQAFQGSGLVSSAPLTQQSDGSFQLVLPSAVLAVGLPLTVQLTPQSTTDPWFVSKPVAVSNSAPFPMPILLAATNGPPNYFSVSVQDPSQGAVNGAVVEAQVTLGTNSYGSTLFSRTATTGDGTGGTSKGVATLSLFSGSMGGPPFAYSFAVMPPANSPYATTCTGPVNVSGGGASASTAQALSPIVLDARAILTGTVFDSYGSPVANVAVAATPGPDPVPGCTATSASSASATTDAHGLFTLYLDPGAYQLDYDPPAGSAAPRLTEYGIVASAGSLSPHDVDLPAAGLFQGTVLAPDMTPLPSATVRLYEPRCSGTDCTASDPPAPILRAQVLTDANGIFRVAVPSAGN